MRCFDAEDGDNHVADGEPVVGLPVLPGVGRGDPVLAEDMELPEGFEPGQMPGGMEKPEGGFGGREAPGDFSFEDGEPNTLFYMQDQVNFFSGLTEQ